MPSCLAAQGTVTAVLWAPVSHPGGFDARPRGGVAAAAEFRREALAADGQGAPPG